MNTDQIAAEAADKIHGVRKRDNPATEALREQTISIIKSAIEKATKEERERADHNAGVADSIARASKQTEDALRKQIFESRAAHASEQEKWQAKSTPP